MRKTVVIRKKREDAEARKEARAGRSDEEQIAKLDSEHYVAAKERARLQSIIDIKKRIQKGKTHGTRTNK